jgi:hypothetical protein
MNFVLDNNENKIYKKKKITHPLSLIHPDLLNPQLVCNNNYSSNNFNYLFSNSNITINYLTSDNFKELFNDLKKNNFNLNNKVFHLNYDKLFKDVVLNKDIIMDFNDNNYLKKLEKKMWSLNELLHHLYIHDKSIANIYPNYFNELFMKDIKLNAKEILFKYFGPS